MDDRSQTHALTSGTSNSAAAVRSFQLEIVQGPQTGHSWACSSPVCSIGSHPSNSLVIDDPTVSRFHCELRTDPGGVKLLDVGSRNGTLLDGVRIVEAFLRTGSLIRLGTSVVRFEYGDDVNYVPVSEREQFGGLLGRSVAIRSTFAFMERAAARDVTVLIEGETGTGKSAAARAIHQASGRKDGPFVVVDCASISSNILESELFGHEKGAFTGASDQRIGAFEEASGGTVFLDEIGELPLDMQPKLLRVLENREVRRIGTNRWVPVDVRVICATNRDLRREVNVERFRSDLYYRLAVVTIGLPPLRQRPEDVPLLARRILTAIDPEVTEALMTPAFAARLERAAWPGNVRELRNYLERCVVFGGPTSMADVPRHDARPRVDLTVPFADARKQLIDEFEHAYLEKLLLAHKGKVAAAAKASGIDRVHLYRLLRRHGLRE